MMQNISPKKILFICLGNICRSPAAHAVMEAKLETYNLSDKVKVDSAGIGGWHIGQLPDSRMRVQGAKRGYNVNHHARQFNAATDFDLFDKIIVMDRENYKAITALASSDKDAHKVFMMADFFVKNKGTEVVPDPYYGTEKDFDYALDLIEDGCEGLIDVLKNEMR